MSAFSNLLAELHSLARLPGFSPRLVINGEPDGSRVDFR